MEFDEMKKIWSKQNDEPLYAINEKALHNLISSKKNKAIHITNISEFVSIVVNIAVGLFLFTTGPFVLAIWMIIVGLYSLGERIRRKMGDNKFDRTMLGDLDHAMSVANYQVRFSGLMRWNIIPVCLLILWGLWGKENTIALIVGLILFSIVAFFGSNWEHNYYKTRRDDIVRLRETMLKADESVAMDTQRRE